MLLSDFYNLSGSKIDLFHYISNRGHCIPITGIVFWSYKTLRVSGPNLKSYQERIILGVNPKKLIANRIMNSLHYFAIDWPLCSESQRKRAIHGKFELKAMFLIKSP